MASQQKKSINPQKYLFAYTKQSDVSSDDTDQQAGLPGSADPRSTIDTSMTNPTTSELTSSAQTRLPYLAQVQAGEESTSSTRWLYQPYRELEDSINLKIEREILETEIEYEDVDSDRNAAGAQKTSNEAENFAPTDVLKNSKQRLLAENVAGHMDLSSRDCASSQGQQQQRESLAEDERTVTTSSPVIIHEPSSPSTRMFESVPLDSSGRGRSINPHRKRIAAGDDESDESWTESFHNNSISKYQVKSTDELLRQMISESLAHRGNRSRTQSPSTSQDHLSKYPKFVIPIQDNLSVMRKARAELKSRLEPRYDPSMIIEWFKNDVPIQAGGRYAIYFNHGYAALIISGFDEQDNGQYTCVATNSCGTDRMQATLRLDTCYLIDKAREARLREEKIRRLLEIKESMRQSELREAQRKAEYANKRKLEAERELEMRRRAELEKRRMRLERRASELNQQQLRQPQQADGSQSLSSSREMLWLHPRDEALTQGQAQVQTKKQDTVAAEGDSGYVSVPYREVEDSTILKVDRTIYETVKEFEPEANEQEFTKKVAQTRKLDEAEKRAAAGKIAQMRQQFEAQAQAYKTVNASDRGRAIASIAARSAGKSSLDEDARDHLFELRAQQKKQRESQSYVRAPYRVLEDSIILRREKTIFETIEEFEPESEEDEVKRSADKLTIKNANQDNIERLQAKLSRIRHEPIVLSSIAAAAANADHLARSDEKITGSGSALSDDSQSKQTYIWRPYQEREDSIILKRERTVMETIIEFDDEQDKAVRTASSCSSEALTSSKISSENERTETHDLAQLTEIVKLDWQDLAVQEASNFQMQGEPERLEIIFEKRHSADLVSDSLGAKEDQLNKVQSSMKVIETAGVNNEQQSTVQSSELAAQQNAQVITGFSIRRIRGGDTSDEMLPQSTSKAVSLDVTVKSAPSSRFSTGDSSQQRTADSEAKVIDLIKTEKKHSIDRVPDFEQPGLKSSAGRLSLAEQVTSLGSWHDNQDADASQHSRHDTKITVDHGLMTPDTSLDDALARSLERTSRLDLGTRKYSSIQRSSDRPSHATTNPRVDFEAIDTPTAPRRGLSDLSVVKGDSFRVSNTHTVPHRQSSDLGSATRTDRPWSSRFSSVDRTQSIEPFNTRKLMSDTEMDDRPILDRYSRSTPNLNANRSTLLGPASSETLGKSPRFMTPLLDNLTVRRRTRVELKSRVEPLGDDSMKIEWYKDDVLLKPIQFKLNTYFNYGYATLAISGFDESDNGRYTCVATNQMGSDRVQATLQVDDRYKQDDTDAAESRKAITRLTQLQETMRLAERMEAEKRAEYTSKLQVRAKLEIDARLREDQMKSEARRARARAIAETSESLAAERNQLLQDYSIIRRTPSIEGKYQSSGARLASPVVEGSPADDGFITEEETSLSGRIRGPAKVEDSLAPDRRMKVSQNIADEPETRPQLAMDRRTEEGQRAPKVDVAEEEAKEEYQRIPDKIVTSRWNESRLSGHGNNIRSLEAQDQEEYGNEYQNKGYKRDAAFSLEAERPRQGKLEPAALDNITISTDNVSLTRGDNRHESGSTRIIGMNETICEPQRQEVQSDESDGFEEDSFIYADLKNSESPSLDEDILRDLSRLRKSCDPKDARRQVILTPSTSHEGKLS